MCISYQVFLDELARETDWLKNGGTTYRVKTAELSLEVANKTSDIDAFSSRDMVMQLVTMLLPDIDVERAKDVAKMLYTVYSTLELEANIPLDIKQMLFERKKRRKSKLALVPNI